MHQEAKPIATLRKRNGRGLPCNQRKLIIAGKHGTKDLKTEKLPLKIKGLYSKGAFNRSACTPVNISGKYKRQLQQT